MFRYRSLLLGTPWGTLGELAAAAFVLAALSGVAVAVPYNPADGFGSLASLLLGNAPAVFFRNLHYWSGQLCLVLTVLHLWDHLRLGTEAGVSRGVWFRLTLTLPLLVFLMLSGFLLRGDVDAQQALRIVSQILGQVPGVGPLAVTFLFGRGKGLDVVYMQHAATATILVWLFIIEHARRLWPRPAAVLATGLGAAILSLGLTPGLHDGLDPIVKGPWYFMGLQELLHWTQRPIWALLGGLLFVVILFAIRSLQASDARRVKQAMLALGLAYGLLCLVGGFFRGENWSGAAVWPRGGGNLHAGWVFAPTPAPPVPLPRVQGRPEGCLVCHKDVTGLGNAHRPEAIGCAACHGGNPLTLQQARAHEGMRLVPGNMADAQRSCGSSACHGDIVPRVERSVMATLSGLVAVDRQVFGEAPPDGPPVLAHVADLQGTPADTHLRQLCASCHLGERKTEPGPDNGDTPGGGCIACHLEYAPAAAKALVEYQRQKAAGPAKPPSAHPAISLAVDKGKCFLCHSRSGRISTNYEGWMELHDPPDRLRSTVSSLDDPLHRTLVDDRVFERTISDVHHARGLDCVDCHTAKEAMGDGKAHARKSGQVRLACQDCHAKPGETLPSLPASALDAESRRLLALRKWPGPKISRFLRTGQGEALVNGTFDRAGRPILLRKRTGQPMVLKPQTGACAASQGHARLGCGSCHTSWAPSCRECHTTFDPQQEAYDWLTGADVRGAWKETSGPFEARLPTLGVQDPAGAGKAALVQTFVPGMILTIERPATSPRFQRLYARTEPHTTQRKVRSCKSCHNDPQALGYGKGRLSYERTPRGGRWSFLPDRPPGPDGLPADAWIPFLGTRPGPVSTRSDVRPFSVVEQKRILEVGACLTCHEGRSATMEKSIQDFPAALRRRTPRCLSPVWD